MSLAEGITRGLKQIARGEITTDFQIEEVFLQTLKFWSQASVVIINDKGRRFFVNDIEMKPTVFFTEREFTCW
jgi:hypothetical protein